MLHLISELTGYTISASDGEIGQVEDFYFDDQHWTVRYLVVDTGGWLVGRKVLISPISIGRAVEMSNRLRSSCRKSKLKIVHPSIPISQFHDSTKLPSTITINIRTIGAGRISGVQRLFPEKLSRRHRVISNWQMQRLANGRNRTIPIYGAPAR